VPSLKKHESSSNGASQATTIFAKKDSFRQATSILLLVYCCKFITVFRIIQHFMLTFGDVATFIWGEQALTKTQSAAITGRAGG
jgi:hypothetical protein